MTPEEIHDITTKLAAPFDDAEIKFKPQTVSGARALAVPFVDARVIQDRLDEVLGVMGWQDSYTPLPDGSVVCRLQIRLGTEWIAKEDVGGQSEQPDEGDRRKASFSDALKRAAVKYGIGRYLYRHKPQWYDYDPQKRQFVKMPSLHWNKAKVASTASSSPAEKQEPVPPKVQTQTPAPTTASTQSGQEAKKPKPTDGKELLSRLKACDEQMTKNGKIKSGELVQYVKAEGKKAGLLTEIEKWDSKGIELAVQATKDFQKNLQQAA